MSNFGLKKYSILFLAGIFMFPFFCYANELIDSKEIMISPQLDSESAIPIPEQTTTEKATPAILYEYTKYEEATADTYKDFTEDITKRTETYQIFDTNEPDVKIMVIPPISNYYKDTETDTWLKTYKTTNFDEVYGVKDTILRNLIGIAYALTETESSMWDGSLRNGANADTNYTSDTDLRLYRWNTDYDRTILSFTLPDVAGTISDVLLNLYQNNWGLDNTIVNIHELTETPIAGEVTWNSYSTGNNWATAGGDYNADVIDTMSMQTENTYHEAKLQGAGADNPLTMTFDTTYNLLIKYVDESSMANQYHMFSSEEGADAPNLEITYTETATTTEATTTLDRVTGDWTDELTVITGYTEHYDTSTSTPDWTEKHYYHIPFIVWIIITTISLFIMDRIIIEFLIRWRR